jgi:hypothetical protein
LGRKDSGIFLVQLMIAVILISVIATAYWNFRSGPVDPLPQEAAATTDNGFIQAALDEIGYHICFARRNNQNDSGQPLLIKEEIKSDRVIVLHNNVRYEYFVDEDCNLVRRQGPDEVVMAGGIQSLKVARLGSQTVVVTITMNSLNNESRHPGGILSRSFSTVVAANGIS